MPAKSALNVSLTKPLRDFVEAQVASGRFQTASEVVRSALRLLQDDLNSPQSKHALIAARVTQPTQGLGLRRAIAPPGVDHE